MRNKSGLSKMIKNFKPLEIVKAIFSKKIIEKYRPAPKPYFDSAYIVFLAVKKTPKESVTPLYARNQYINYQIRQYAQKEIIREIHHEWKPAGEVNLFRTIHPTRFFEQINLSTRREWGRLFYSLSKEYETFYREQYHKDPYQESRHTEKETFLTKKEIREHETLYVTEQLIYQNLKEQYRKREIRFRELEKQVETCITKCQRTIRSEEIPERRQAIRSGELPERWQTIRPGEIPEKRQTVRQGELPERQQTIRTEAITEQMNTDINKITIQVMENLQRHLELERMRHGF